jgi:nicotinamide mononucleotide (NMN) deamidase PncC
MLRGSPGDLVILAAVGAIHAAPERLVYEFSGAGSVALAWLHAVPGSSKTILEATDRYSTASLVDLLGRRPDHFVSPETARAMSQAAYERARHLSEHLDRCLGVACTATITSNRPKRGDHRCFVAITSDDGVQAMGLVLRKGRQDRVEEEEVISRLVIRGIAEACQIDHRLSITLEEGDHIVRM